VQRAPKDVRVYLEAALAANDPVAAKPALDFIADTHLADVAIDPLVRQLRAAATTADPLASAASVPSIARPSPTGSGR